MGYLKKTLLIHFAANNMLDIKTELGYPSACRFCSAVYYIFAVIYLPTRRSASVNFNCRRVSVYLSICLSHAGIAG